MTVRWLPLLVIFLVSFINLGSVEARNIAAKRECSICHIMWLDAFQQADVTPLIPYDPKPLMNTGRQDVVSNERNCFSCHDGYILDSRFVWEDMTYSHPVGVEPSDKVNMPSAKEAQLRPELNLFPLNSDGKVYCGTCHSAHGVDWKQDESPVFLRAKNIESSICLNCHKNRSTGPDGGNHPIQAGFEYLASRMRENDLTCVGHYLGDNPDMIAENVKTFEKLVKS